MADEGNVKFQFTGNVNDALKEIDRLRKQIDGLKKGMRETKKAAKDVTEGGFNSWIAGAVTMTAITGAVWKGVDALQAYKDKLKEIGAQARSEHEKVRSFFSILPNTPEGLAFGQQMIAAGARVGGMKPGDTAALIEPIVSKLNVGDPNIIDAAEQAQIEGAFKAALKGAFIGMPAEMAGLVEVMGSVRGMKPGEAVGLTIEASSASAYSKEAFGTIVPGLVNYRTLEEGLAAAVAISASQPAEEAKTLVRSAAKVLGAGGDFSPFAEVHGLVGLTDAEKVLKLRREAVMKGDQSLPVTERVAAYTAGYQAEAGMDERVARAIAAIIQNPEGYFSALKKLRGTEGEAVTETKFADLMAVPGQKNTFQQNVAEALTLVNQMYGDAAEKAAEEVGKLVQQGIDLQSEGKVVGVDPTTGRATEKFGMTRSEAEDLYRVGPKFAYEVIKRLLADPLGKDAFQGALEETLVPLAYEKAANGATLDESLNRFGGELEGRFTERRDEYLESIESISELKTVLQENTEATKENTAVTRGQATTPGTGRARNAGIEER